MRVSNRFCSLVFISAFLSPTVLAQDTDGAKWMPDPDQYHKTVPFRTERFSEEDHGSPSPDDPSLEISSKEAAKLYFRTLLVTLEVPQLRAKLERELNKKFQQHGQIVTHLKLVDSIDNISLIGTGLWLVLSVVPSLPGSGRLKISADKLEGPCSIFSGVTICNTLVIAPLLRHKLVKENEQSFKTIEEAALRKAVQEELVIRSGLVGELLRWSPEKETKFTNAYRNALVPKLEIIPSTIWDKSRLGRVEVKLPDERALVIDVLRKTRLASPHEIEALKKMFEAERKISQIYFEAKRLADLKEDLKELEKSHEEYIEVLLAAIRELKKEPDLVSDEASLKKLAEIETEGEAALMEIRRVRELTKFLQPEQP